MSKFNITHVVYFTFFFSSSSNVHSGMIYVLFKINDRNHLFHKHVDDDVHCPLVKQHHCQVVCIKTVSALIASLPCYPEHWVSARIYDITSIIHHTSPSLTVRVRAGGVWSSEEEPRGESGLP